MRRAIGEPTTAKMAAAAAVDLEGGHGNATNGGGGDGDGGGLSRRNHKQARRLVSMGSLVNAPMLLLLLLLLAAHGGDQLGCQAADAGDLSAPLDARDLNRAIELAAASYGGADASPALLKSKAMLNYAIETGFKKLADNYRSELLLQQQLAADERDGRLEALAGAARLPSAPQRFARALNQMQRNGDANALRLLQLASADGADESADSDLLASGRPLMMIKKASPKHTPRFGRRR